MKQYGKLRVRGRGQRWAEGGEVRVKSTHSFNRSTQVDTECYSKALHSTAKPVHSVGCQCQNKKYAM